MFLACFAAGTLAAFEVKPLIFPADAEATVTIRAENDAEKKILAEEPLYYLSDRSTWSDDTPRTGDRPLWQPLIPTRRDGEVTVSVRLPGEGWHNLRFGKLSEKGRFIKGYTNLMVYSLKPDLFAMRPWKGDIHQHSVRCGHAKLEPKVIPAYNRRVGFDFMALSEHRIQSASVEAIEAAKPWKCGMALFTAEEFHTDGVLHSVAVGHTAGINDWQKAHPEEFKRRTDEELKKPVYREYGMDPWLQREAAMSTVLYQVAREQGAKVVVFSHPTWMVIGIALEAMPLPYRNFMFEQADFDALEIPNVTTGSFHPRTFQADRLMLMNAHLTELVIRRKKAVPVVAASDSHNQTVPYFGSAYTVFFAKKCTVDEFAAAVKDLRTLGLRNAGEANYLCVGPSRLMKFEQFLEKCYWPKHDKLCREQGELLLRLAAKGDTSVLPEVARLAKAIDDYRESCYAPRR